jgi:hypothetical protein
MTTKDTKVVPTVSKERRSYVDVQYIVRGEREKDCDFWDLLIYYFILLAAALSLKEGAAAGPAASWEASVRRSPAIREPTEYYTYVKSARQPYTCTLHNLRNTQRFTVGPERVLLVLGCERH